MPITQAFSVGEWTVHPREHRISRGGESVALEPRVMQLLIRLAESPGRVVLRSELLDDVWSGMVVSEEALFRAVSGLRRAFGDDSRNPTVLETIPKAGYRLVAPVDLRFAHGDSVPLLSANVPLPWNTSRPGFSTTGLIALALIALAGVIAASFVLDRGDGRGARPLLASAALTSFFGFEIQPALSPDGTTIAFIWSGPDDGPINVYIQSLTADSPLQLTDDAFYEFSPAWSPEGSRIAFARSGTGIFVRPTIGGSERLVAPLGPSLSPSLDWSPVSDHLVVSDVDSAGTPSRLWLIDVGSGARTPLTERAAGSLGDRDPAFSPNGRHIAFVRQGLFSDELHVTGADGTGRRTLVANGAGIAGVDWTQDGSALIFSTDLDGAFGLWQVSTLGGEPDRILGGPDQLRDPSLAGSLVAYTRSRREVNLWAFTPGEGTSEIIPGSTGYDGDPALSTGGTDLAFVSDRQGRSALYTQADGQAPVRRTETLRNPANPSWAPRDDWVAFDAIEGGRRQVYVTPSLGGPARRVTDDALGGVSPAFSPDNAWIYFASPQEGDWVIRRTAFPPQEPFSAELILTGAYHPAFTRDGALLYSRPGEAGVWTTGVSGPVRIADVPASRDADGWVVDGMDVWVLDRSDGENPVFRAFDMSGRPVSEPIAAPAEARRLAVRGGRMVVERLDHSVFDIMLARRD